MGRKLLIVLLILFATPVAGFILFAINFETSRIGCQLELARYPTSEVKSEISQTYNLIMQDRNTFIAKMEDKPAECVNAEGYFLDEYSSKYLFGTDNSRVDNDKIIDQILLSYGYDERDYELEKFSLENIKYYKKKVGKVTYRLSYNWNIIRIADYLPSYRYLPSRYESFDQVKNNQPDLIRKINPRLENTPYVFSINIEHSKY